MSRTLVATCICVALLVATGCQKQAPEKDSAPAGAGPKANPRTAPQVDQQDLEQASQALKQQAQDTQQQLPPGHPPLDELTQQTQKKAEQAADKLSGELPPGHPPLEDLKQGAKQKAGELAKDAKLPAGHPALDQLGKVLTYSAPEGWQAQKPSSAMRKAQFALPGPEGSDAGELVVYYFGKGQGGPVGDNLKRWRAMFVDDDGKPVGDDAVEQQELEVNGLKVTVLDVRGTLQASVMPGVAPTTSTHPRQRMLAAIIETPDGPWFIKAVGPQATMEAQHENFMKFIKSVKY